MVGDGAERPDADAVLEPDVDHHEVLDVAQASDLDRVALGADHRVGPDRCALGQRHPAVDLGAGRDPAALVELLHPLSAATPSPRTSATVFR